MSEENQRQQDYERNYNQPSDYQSNSSYPYRNQQQYTRESLYENAPRPKLGSVVLQAYLKVATKQPVSPEKLTLEYTKYLVNSLKAKTNKEQILDLIETVQLAFSVSKPLNWDPQLLEQVTAILQTQSVPEKEAAKRNVLSSILKLKRTRESITMPPLAEKNNMAALISGIAERIPVTDPAHTIANMLEEVGPSCTRSATTFRDFLNEIGRTNGRLDEASLASVIFFFSDKSGVPDTSSTGLSSAILGSVLQGRGQEVGNSGWNLESVAQVLSEDYSERDWVAVARAWDFSNFLLKGGNQFRVLLELYRAGAKTTPPLTAFTSNWNNTSGQLSIIEAMMVVSPSVFMVPLNEEELADAATAPPVDQSSTVNPQCWASMDILHRLLQLSDIPSLYRRVRDLFVKGLMSCPEVLLCALVRLQLRTLPNQSDSNAAAGMQLKADVMRELVPLFFRPNVHHRVQNGPAALRRLYSISPSTVTAACFEAWRSTAAEGVQNRLACVIHIINIARLLPSPPEAIASLLNGNKDAEFSIAVAFVMADSEYLQLKPWLGEKLISKASALPFAISLTSYLRKNVSSAMPRGGQDGKTAALVSVENIVTSLQLLQSRDSSILGHPVGRGSHNEVITLGDNVKAVSDMIERMYPALRGTLYSQPSDSSALRGGMPQVGRTFDQQGSGQVATSDDVEEMATQYFQKIYTGEQSIGEFVEMLKRFKTSSNQKENEIFACMVHNLFDEYRYFSKYPEKELRITGILFGALIQEQLVSSITLGIALRYVLEALRKPPSPQGSTTTGGKMFKFGMFALEQFKARLHEWPQYCSHIVQIPHLKDGFAALVSEIELEMSKGQVRASADSNQPDGSDADSKGSNHSDNSRPQLQGAEEGVDLTNVGLGVDNTPRVAEFGPKLGRAVNDETADVDFEAPTENILDAVQFLVNNLSPKNVEQKAQELRDMLDPRYFGWLGHFLVVKRISTQANFHSLYLALLDHLGDYGKGLVEAIIASAYKNIGKLLRSPKITTSSSERSYLKNLGIWLGQVTLARNRPILQIMLDCKELLLQGYENGKLIAVAPFLAKTLEGAKNSIIFRPPNPWLMSILSVFRAVYDVEGLKMNIKFEVEVLCKNLGILLEDIPNRSDILARRIAPLKERNPDFNVKAQQKTQIPPGRMIGSPDVKSLGISLGSRGGTDAPSSGEQSTVIPNLASYVSLNANLSQVLQNYSGTELQGLSVATLKRLVPLAVDRAIREIIQPVVERSVTIACITTREITTKDFAMESDETKVKKAGQLMVSNLAGSLALVTCREPLRSSISTHLRQLLSTAMNREKFADPEQAVIEQIVQICATDNLDLGCMLIEKAATEKAVRDVDEALKAAVTARKSHRESTGQEFFDMSIFSNGLKYPTALPAQLRPAPGFLRAEHFQLYEGFQKLPRSSTGVMPTSSASSSRSSTPTQDADTVQAKNQSTQRVPMDALTALSTKLDAAVSALLAAAGTRASEIKMSLIPPDHQIRQLLAAVKTVMPNAGPSGNVARPLTSSEEDMVLGFAQGIFKRLYELKLTEPLKLESLVALLENLNVYCPKLGNDMGTWSTYAPANTDQQRRLHRTILLLLVRSRLLSVNDLDTFLAARADGGRNHIWLEFSLLFIRTALMERIAAANDFPKLMDLMHTIADGNSQAPQEIVQSYRPHIIRMLEETSGIRGFSASGGRSALSTSDTSASSGVLRQGSSLSQQSLASLSTASRTIAEATEAFSLRDPPNSRQQVTALVEAWIRLSTDGSGSTNNLVQYLQALQRFGVGKADDQTERFLRISSLVIVEAVLKSTAGGGGINYSFVDVYSNLLTFIFKRLNTAGAPDQVTAERLVMLNKILGVVVRTMIWDYEIQNKRKTPSGAWDQRPWYRIFLNLISDINKPDPELESMRPTIISMFGAALHVCQPLVLPGFAFAWLDLISHRHFMPNALLLPEEQGWNIVHQLLIDNFLFLEPFLARVELTQAMKRMYEGTLKITLLLLHDFPSFLSGYHVSFCNVIPETCVQLRNIILSATPKEMSPPDPFTPNLKIDLLPEISMSPKILSPVLDPIEDIRESIDAVLSDGPGKAHPKAIIGLLRSNGGTDLAIARVKSLVIYLAAHALTRIQSSKMSVARTAEIDVFETLMELDDRNRYLVLNCIADELRYPSNHTHYLSCVMLYLFSETKNMAVKEQVTRVLLERLIVARPHPWGILVTFIELIKNQRYQFWSFPFTRCATEIEKVFESVARSCLPPGTQRSALVGGDGQQ